MDTKIILPCAALRNHIRYFFVLANQNDHFIEKFKIIPNGLTGLIFQENPNVFYNNDNQTLPQVFLFGQAIHYFHLSVKGRFQNIGVIFQPTALKSLFGMDASELTDRHISITDITSASITDELLHANSLGEKINALENFF